MTDDTPEFEIAEEAPTDADGHPVHPDPDKNHRICAATKSDRTTPTEHGRERDDVEYCTLAAGWGVDDTSTGTCDHHLGAVDNRGENNPNYKHGAYSEHFKSDLSEREEEAFEDLADALDDEERTQTVFRETAAELFLKYKRSGDPRVLREARQLLSEFNVVDATDHQEVEFDVSSMSSEEKEQLDDLFDRDPQE